MQSKLKYIVMAKTRKIGRDAETGQFIPIEEAKRRKKTAIVEPLKHLLRLRKRSRRYFKVNLFSYILDKIGINFICFI